MITDAPRQLDLFGAQQKPCAWCGTVFAFVIEGRGRPKAFCSDACRAARSKQQRRTWNNAHYLPASKRGAG